MMSLFSRSKRPRALRALCYGKLPIAKDFLVSRGGEAGRRFQNWLGALDRGGRAAVLPRPQRVLFARPDLEHYVIGTVWDSADAGGVRKFPFALYFELARKSAGANAVSPVFSGLAQWEELEREYAVLSQISRTGEFYRQLRSIRHPVGPAEGGGDGPAERFAEAARPHSPQALAEALFGADALPRWTRLLWRIAREVRPASTSAGPVPTFALRLPLADSVPDAVQVESWLKFIRSRVEGLSTMPSLVFPAPYAGDRSARPATFSVIFRPVRESDVWLLQESVGDSDVTDLTDRDPPPPESEGDEAFAAGVREAFTDPAADLTELMRPIDPGAGGI